MSTEFQTIIRQTVCVLKDSQKHILRVQTCVRQTSAELQTLINIPNQDMPAYFNSADIVLLTSLWEGSPNVIKEAMACNCKIVSVDVGDVKEVIGNTKGCQVTSFNSDQIANAITKLLAYKEIPKGRSKVEHLNATTIAKKLTQIYTTARI